MAEARVGRRLAAIVAADVAGYSRLMGLDEVGTARTLREHRAVADALVSKHGGRIVKTTGDGVLLEFPSVVDAVECAVVVQAVMAERNEGVPADRRMLFRIGINLGDILIEGDDILGDGVNIAARIENECEPGGVYLSDDAFRQVRGKTAFVFDDLGEKSLKNIDRQVRLYAVRSASFSTEAPAVADKPLPLPDKPSIAVLPFQNMSGDPEQEYFADGMVEEIITSLSRIRSLFVIARNSTFTYKGQTVDVKRVSRELGVRYVLEGSIRKVGNRLRITGQLIDAVSGAHLWADHFEGILQDVFELQDMVASAVAGVIEPALLTAERRRSGQRATSDLTAYDLYLRALSDVILRQKEGTVHALELLTQAIERDPLYGPALVLAARCHLDLYVGGWTNDPGGSRRNGLTLARQALRVAEDDPYVLAHAAHILGFFGEDIAAALALVDRALQLTRVMRAVGTGAVGLGYGPGWPKWPSSISRPPFASARAKAGLGRIWGSELGTSLHIDSFKQKP
jgi:adenylate cyclase